MPRRAGEHGAEAGGCRGSVLAELSKPGCLASRGLTGRSRGVSVGPSPDDCSVGAGAAVLLWVSCKGKSWAACRVPQAGAAAASSS